MTDYTELIRQLKTYEDGYGLYDAAADAIEALQAEVGKYKDAFGRLSKTAVELEQRVSELKQLPKRGEIVRCGECKYHLPETERTNPYCNRFHCMKPDDWFCADGEREVQE